MVGLFSFPGAAADLNEAVRELVRKLLPGEPGDSVSLNVRNISGVQLDSRALRRAVESALGSRVVEHSPVVELTVTLSQNPTTLLLVGEAKRGDDRTAVIVPVQPLAPVSAAARAAITSTQVWEQEAPFLDLAVAGNVMLVLEAGRAAVYEQGQFQAALPIPAEQPRPRDLRGRLLVNGSGFTAWLPGTTCRGKLQPPSIACEAGSTPWTIAPSLSGGLVAARNYFDGTLEGGRRVVPFFSAALVDNRLITAGLDGQARLYAQAPDPTASWSEWSDDIAGVSSACGRHILTAEDRTIKAYEIVEDKPAASGDPVAVPGPVTALWEAADGRQATAIVRDESSGRHAAFSLSITCSH